MPLFSLSYWTTVLVTLSIAYVIVAPIETFLHECGHAIVARLFTSQRVDVCLGYLPKENEDFKQQDHVRWKLAGIDFHVRFWPLPGFVGCANYQGSMSLSKHMLFCLAGPLVSLVLLVPGGYAIYLLWQASPFWLYMMEFSTSMVLNTFLRTALPTRPTKWGAYAGMESDGYQALQSWRKLRKKAKATESSGTLGSGRWN
jgi:hypothetical protein